MTFDVGAEIWGKRLQLLREFVPKLSRMAVLMGPAYQPGEAIFESLETPARVLGIALFTSTSSDRPICRARSPA